MTSIATLRATNCARLMYITDGVVAACGTKTAYVFQFTGSKTVEASCTAPREADVFVPWLPPGAPAVSGTRALYSTSKDGSFSVVAQDSDGTSAAPREIISSLEEKVEEMYIFYQSILVLRTARHVRFYFLDPSTAAATPMGTCALPAWSGSRDARVEVTSSECWAAALEKHLCVMCFSPKRVFAAVVVCATSTSAVVVRQTAEAGVLIPFAAAAASTAKVAGWTVRWGRQELLLLCQSGIKADTKRELLALSLRAAGSTASHPQLDRWVATETLQNSLGGASAEAVAAATDVCCDGDGTHVWLCDTVTNPVVTLREVAATWNTEPEVTLAGTNSNARLTVACGGHGVFVLAGRSLYVVRGTGVAAAAAAAVNGEKVVAAPPPETVAAPAAVPAAPAPAATAVAETTMSDWLEKRSNKAQAAPAKANKKPASTSSVFTSSSSAIKAALLQYVFGEVPSVSYVVRDVVYVRESASANNLDTVSAGAATCAVPRHYILAAIDEKFGTDHAQHALACLRYAAVAQSLHPYTVLQLLNVRRDDGAGKAAPPDGLQLAVASLLSRKPTLQHGGLQRLPAFAATTAAFFSIPGGPFVTRLQQVRYTADVCAAAMAALASGALGAARLLFAVADRAVSVLYGGRFSDAVAAGEHVTTEEQTYEATIADSISLMRSYVEWSLAASTSLGVMSAHVGTPQTLTKEAALRDGQSHPIDTSRQVEIRPLKVVHLPKKTL